METIQQSRKQASMELLKGYIEKASKKEAEWHEALDNTDITFSESEKIHHRFNEAKTVVYLQTKILMEKGYL